jgi:YjbE family integral membrane protein
VNLAALADPEFWARWLAIVLLDLTLAGDNALVIALAVRNLPRRQQWQGRLWGTFGAVALRVLFIGIITFILRIPLLQAVGGLVLCWIGVKLLTQQVETHDVRHGGTLFEAIWIIIVADVIMSLDNVLAVAAAAHGDMLLVIFGVGLSIPIVIWGSGILARLMGRFPWIVTLGAGVLGWVSGEMILKDRVVRASLGESVVDAFEWVLPVVLGIGVIVVGRWWVARRMGWLGRERDADIPERPRPARRRGHSR